MALLEKAVEGLAEGGAVAGAAIGIGALLLVPGLLPAVGRALRPIAVGAIRTGMTVYEQAAAGLREATEDLVAEARAERAEARAEPDAGRGARRGPVRRRSRSEASAG
jgi:hypothetical protein